MFVLQQNNLQGAQPQDPVAYIPVCLKVLGTRGDLSQLLSTLPPSDPGLQDPRLFFFLNHLQDDLLLRTESRPDTALSALCLPSHWLHVVVVQTQIGFMPFHQKSHTY